MTGPRGVSSPASSLEQENRSIPANRKPKGLVDLWKSDVDIMDKGINGLKKQAGYKYLSAFSELNLP